MGVFQQNRKRWLEKWIDAVFETYPGDSAQFFKTAIDPFSNPVGATIKTGLTELYDLIFASRFDPDAIRSAMGPIVKLRSVQEFTPSEALGFIYDLKKIIRSGSDNPARDIPDVFSRIDQVALIAFDLYMENKQTIYTLRANQARNNVRQLLVKKDLICELPEIDPELTR